MRILMTTINFYPHIGGIETVTKYLAEEFSKKNHEVCVLTNTVNKSVDNMNYRVIRKPSLQQVWQEYKRCDVFVHQQISLKYVWPLLIKRKPWVIVHHGVDLPKGIWGFLKRVLFRFAHNIAVSNATARGYRLQKYKVIYNSYDEEQFYHESDDLECERNGIVFCGKCSEAKGVKLLIDAFDAFKTRTGSSRTLTIIGDHEEKQYLHSYAQKLVSSNDIQFVGFKNPSEIRAIMNKSEFQVVPSIANEAFGVVVLEGMACGCIVIGSSGDGIEEAIGDSGLIFKKGSVSELADTLVKANNLTKEQKIKMKNRGYEHLKDFKVENIADEYLKYFKAII